MKDHIDGGFVILARAIRSSSLMKMKGDDVKLAMYFLAEANWQDVKWYDQHQHKEIVVKRGEFTGSLRSWATGASMSLKSARTSLRRLLGHGFVKDITAESVKRAHGYTHLTVHKYEKYQDVTNYVVSKSANDGHRTGTGRAQDGQTSLNKDKQLKQLNNKTSCQDEFQESLNPDSQIQAIVNLWNSICVNLPKIKTCVNQRKQNILNRLAQFPNLDDWHKVFEWLNRSSHHCGNNSRKWVATIDFIVERGKSVKFNEILEKAGHRIVDSRPNSHPDSEIIADGMTMKELEWKNSPDNWLACEDSTETRKKKRQASP